MLISRSSHNQVVQILQSRIAELQAERDFYRDLWVKSHGAEFPSVVNSGEPPSLERSLVAPELVTSWSADDRSLFEDWARSHGFADAEATEEWRRLYGEQSPLMALTV